jgi:hypothetical protein
MAGGDQDVHAKYKDATKRGVGGHESDNNFGLPSYIKPGSAEETHWRKGHPEGQKSRTNTFQTGSSVAHSAAQAGDIATLRRELEEKKDYVHAKDSNGWTVSEELLLVRWGFTVLNTSNHCFIYIYSLCTKVPVEAI